MPISQILKRIIKAEKQNVVIGDLRISLKLGESIDLLGRNFKGEQFRTMEQICKSVDLDLAIENEEVTLWDENGNNLTGIDALNATDIASITDYNNVEFFNQSFIY